MNILMVLATARDKTRLVKSTGRRRNCCWDSGESCIGEGCVQKWEVAWSQEFTNYVPHGLIYNLIQPLCFFLPRVWQKEMVKTLEEISFHITQEQHNPRYHLSFPWCFHIQKPAKLDWEIVQTKGTHKRYILAILIHQLTYFTCIRDELLIVHNS